MARGVRAFSRGDGDSRRHPFAFVADPHAANQNDLRRTDGLNGPSGQGDADPAPARLLSRLPLLCLQPVLDDDTLAAGWAALWPDPEWHRALRARRRFWSHRRAHSGP